MFRLLVTVLTTVTNSLVVLYDYSYIQHFSDQYRKEINAVSCFEIEDKEL